MQGAHPLRWSPTTIATVALVLTASAGCSSADEEPTFGHCQAILSVGDQTYWGTEIGNEHIRLTERLGRGVLSSCTDGTFVHRATGQSTTVYRLEKLDTGTAVVSPGGPGDPFTLWVKTTGTEPPFVVPAELQQVIEDNPVDDRGRE